MKKIYILLLLISAAFVAYYVYDKSLIDPEIDKALAENKKKDLASVDAFIKDIDAIFDGYEKNVKEAVESKPKLRVIWASIKAKFKGDQTNKEALKIYSVHFNKTIFEPENNRLDTSLNTLSYEFDSHKNELYDSIGVILSVKSDFDTSKIFADLKANMQKAYDDATKDVVKDTVVTVISSIVAEELTRKCVTSGVTALFVTAGGASGSVVPGVGTAVGIVIGAVVGTSLDMYLEKMSNEKLEKQITLALSNARQEIKKKYKKSLEEKVAHRNKEYRKLIIAAQK